MGSYRSPYLACVDKFPILFKSQGTGAVTITPQCSGNDTCNEEGSGQGVISCDPDIGGGNANVTISALLPDSACASAEACAITNILYGDSARPFSCVSDPVTACSEGGCELNIECEVNMTGVSGVTCDPFSAQIECSSGNPVDCPNNSDF